MMKYNKGDYFGELALLKNEPRAANVIAEGEMSVVFLERNSFKRLLGPLEDILKRNMKLYSQYKS
jgi:cAMP-dependent protein kinase regulator